MIVLARSTLRPFLLGLASGILLALAYRIPGAWPVMFVALVPLLYGLHEAKSMVQAGVVGFVAAVPLIGTAVWWLFDTLPFIADFGVSPTKGFFFATFSWVVTVVAISFAMGLWAAFMRLLALNKILDLIAAAVLFVAAEFLGMVAFNILTFAPAIQNPPFFSAGFVGYPLMDSESWRQFAAFGGIYVCCFIVIFANLVFYYLLRYQTGKRRIQYLLAFLLLLVVVSVAPIMAWRESLAPPATSSIRVAIESVHFSDSLTLDQSYANERAQNLNFIKTVASSSPDIILLPEGSGVFAPFATGTLESVLPAGNTAVVVDSSAIQTSDGRRPVRSYADSLGGQTGIRDKEILTAQGEYFPSFFKLILALVGAQKQQQLFDEKRGFSTGHGTGIPLQVKGARTSVLFCLEVMDPGLALGIKNQQGDNLMLVGASHNLFSSSETLEQDILRFSQSQAVEADIPLVSSVSQGPAYSIDPYGRVIDSVGTDGKSGMHVDTIQLQPTGVPQAE